MRTPKSYDELIFTDDFMFCKVLSTNPELCRQLLEVILQIKIRKVVCTSTQVPIEITSDGKGIRLDVYVEDDNNTVFDIEMQTTKQKDLPKRSRYYQGMIDLNLIERGARYRDLKKSFIIFVCLDDPFAEALPVYHFENTCTEIPGLSLGDESTKVFINAKGVLSNTLTEDMKSFIAYLNGEKTDNPLVQQIESEVEKVRLHEEWRLEYMTLQQRELQKYDEGREEGRAEGRAEGKLETLTELVKDGTLTAEKAAKKANITTEELLLFIAKTKEK